MARRVCPVWVGYLLLNPLRKLWENPDKILAPFVDEGMTVLEPGCGMGFFTLSLARMVGSSGRVVTLDVQPKMLSVLRRRAERAGLLERIELRWVGSDGMGVKDLSGMVDLVAALHMVHEVPDQAVFFAEVREALKPDGKLLIMEPKGHVSQAQFEQTVSTAEKVGFKVEISAAKLGGRGALLVKADVGAETARRSMPVGMTCTHARTPQTRRPRGLAPRQPGYFINSLLRPRMWPSFSPSCRLYPLSEL